ncbi:adenosylcobinamide-GDP ribazoletransferase [Nonomuraea sp. NEAU-A123]|uniref:adenosylcobinamide-GDP ribazoletransferase n=1 Tax=Nonomuraea sp. NEAU-A123 TaxID=2839649 RepID=UPI001BE475DE|nr:adenosylcobinamide-GDP ribazoletransferase [Nonomuraea sp. NEAU-A123]MBT2228966.1 adenosylcobinamide-GDP ribazoletransferase [Nonomuraea sp. NEAU-A123]
MDGTRFAIGTLSVFPVRVTRVDREVAGRAMVLAPALGLVLGLVSCLPLLLPGPPLLGAGLAVGLLAVLTRGLHLDGLADLADGLGSGKPAPQALDIMKKSDIGPFGVMTLVLVLVVQVAALSGLGPPALVTACVTGRLALTWACRSAVPAARPDGLGALVAGTVRPGAAWAATATALAAAAALGSAADHGLGLMGLGSTASHGLGLVTGDGLGSVASHGLGSVAGHRMVYVLPLGVVAGLGAALLLLRHARRRLGGVTGDVLGALVETATAATLTVCALFG